jgi:hypothetical protein
VVIVNEVKINSQRWYRYATFALLFVIVYGIAIAVSLNFSEIDGAASTVIRTKPSFVLISVCISLLMVAFVQTFFQGTKFLKIMPISMAFPLGIYGLVLFQLLKGADWFKSYGDGGSLATIINESNPFSRWLLGSTALIDLFGLVNHFVLSISAQQFVVIASSACMCISTIAVIRSYGNKTYVLLPLTTPIWIAFSFGYDEYYPFIVGIFLLVALWICVKSVEELSFVRVALTGIIPALYVGFAPLAVFALVKTLRKAKSLKDFAIGVALSAFAYVVAVEVGWPAGHSNYLAVLSDNMNLGDTRAIHNYQGTALSSKSPFYSLRSALSFFHVRDMMFNSFFACGIAGFLILVVIFVYLKTKLNGNLSAGVHDHKPNVLAMAFVLWNVLYFVFMIPKLGPIADIDLFFASNLVFAIWGGVLLEKLFDYRQLSIRIRANALSAMVALNGPVVAALVIYGIRR